MRTSQSPTQTPSTTTGGGRGGPSSWRATAGRLLVAALLAAAAAPTLAPAPAEAIPGIRRIHDTTASNSTALKFLPINCPPHHNAIGGHVVIQASDPGQIRIIAAVPNGAESSGSGYAIVATEQQAGTTQNWMIDGEALCAPASALPGLEYRHTRSGFDSAGTHEAVASCPTGKKLVGAGAEAWISSLTDRSGVLLTRLQPVAGSAQQVIAVGSEDEDGFSGNWDVHATAVCINSNAVTNQSVQTDSSEFDSFPFKTTAATCPTGTNLHATGFDVTDGAGQVGVYTLGAENRIARAWAAEDNNGGFNGNWSADGFGLCAS